MKDDSWGTAATATSIRMGKTIVRTGLAVVVFTLACPALLAFSLLALCCDRAQSVRLRSL